MKKFLIFILLIVLNFPTTLIFAETLSNQTISEVNEAISKGLVPKELQGNYSQDITMGEFCKLCTAVIKVWNNNIKYDENMSFLDISDKDILFCIENEITNTIENNKLVPDNPITRQEAAKMLYNTLLVGTNVIQEKHSSEKTPECCIPHSFDDGGKIKSWARNEINHMYRYGVMFGVDDKNYNPDRNCTREQAICAFLRLYNCKYDISKNPVPGSDYYPYGEFAQYYCPDNNVDSNGDYYYFDTEQTKYIDSKGNIYNWEEKGFVYPFYTKYIVYNKNGPGMGSYYKILDKDGNNLIGDCRSIDLKDNFILCKYDEYSEKSEIYDISDKNISFEDSLVLQNDNLISYKGDGLFNIYDENRSFIGIFDINNPSAVKYNRKEYYEKSKNASLIKYNNNIYKDEANKYASSFNNIFTLLKIQMKLILS